MAGDSENSLRESMGIACTSENSVPEKLAERSFQALAQSCLGPPYSGIEGLTESPHHCPMDVRGPKGDLIHPRSS
jgi:hypothetical protein